MVTLLFVMILMYIIIFTVGFISYAFNSIGLNKLAKREGKASAFLAWIPYLNNYTLGRIAFKSNKHAIAMTALGVFSLIFLIAMFFVDLSMFYTLAIASFIFSAISSVYNFIAHYKVYAKYSKSTILMTVLDVISFGILGPFFIFAIRNNDKK
ncbi:MAG: hypothetical protein J6A15_05765 [Clostridia bacterium]|nr:hypothetical protein [Clostridia bacterium]